MKEGIARQIALEIETRFPHIHACVVQESPDKDRWLIGLFNKQSGLSLHVVLGATHEYHEYLCVYRAFAGLPDEMLPVEAQIEKTYLDEIAEWSRKKV